MRDSADKVFGKIKKHGLAVALQECPTIEDRHKKLLDLFPEIKGFLNIARKQLYYFLQKDFGVDLGVCEHCTVGDHRQRCGINYDVCYCDIPQETSCALLNKKENPKSPEPVLV